MASIGALNHTPLTSMHGSRFMSPSRAAFVPTSAAIVSSRRTAAKTSDCQRVSSSRLFLDPYEEQYRRYWAIREEEDIQQSIQQQQQEMEQVVSRPAMPGSTQQYLQCLSSLQMTSFVDNAYSTRSAEGYDEFTNPNPYEYQSQQSEQQQQEQSSEQLSPYDLQYQKYWQDLRQEMMTPEENSFDVEETPTDIDMNSFIYENSAEFSSGNTERVLGSQQHVQESNSQNQHHSQDHDEQQQRQQHIQDIEESFLRTLSNEVQYKKFLNQSPYSLTDIDLRVLFQRFLDNLEDGQQKRNGKFKGTNKRLQKGTTPRRTKDRHCSGDGVGLSRLYQIGIDVRFEDCGGDAAVGTVEYRSMTEPIRVTNPYIDNFVEGRAIGVDVEAKKVAVQLSSFSTVTRAFKDIASSAPCRLEPEPVLTHIVYDDEDSTIKRDESMGAGTVIELKYDYLLCAVGTASRSTIVPGAKEHCFNLKTSQDSKRLRTAIGEALEFASRPDVQEFYYEDEDMQAQARAERQKRVRIAIVGGGPTGVELSGELMDFFSQVCVRADGAFQHLRDDVSVMLVHGGSELLPAMDSDLRERALTALQAQGVELRLNTRLREVGRDYITICQKGSDAEETIPVGITVWAAGNAPVPFVKELLSQLPESAKGSGGRIKVDKWLRCPTRSRESFGSILVLGDVACFESQSKYDPNPEPLPQTAQVAGQQGAFAARMLNRGYDMQQTPPILPEVSSSEEFSLLRLWILARGLEEAPGFNFLSLGLLAYVGQEEALNQVMIGNVPLFNYSGRIAFLLWRSVYLAKQASSRNQALIAFDWARTQSFGRDITRL
ncbi:hypothetical protein HJC23_006406 [Cyclotella cryptica]|uniref:FAD/NAD(P)-binding domain-containing protein n=1 Tax=Cyclotella cryptica TaxID=29204 RepID=A0ABD3R0I6_9STRA